MSSKKPPSWEDRQRKPILLLYHEPTESDINDYPFLRGMGGLLTKFRHPVLVHYCDCYNVMRLCHEKVKDAIARLKYLTEEYEANKENLTPALESQWAQNIEEASIELQEYGQKGKECWSALELLRKGEAEDVKMEDICQGGKFFNVDEEMSKMKYDYKTHQFFRFSRQAHSQKNVK